MEIKRAEVRDAPGPSGHPQLGCLPELRGNPLRLFIDCHKKYGDVVRLPLASGFAAYVVSHPEAIRHVLQDNYTNYTKGYARSDRDNVETADQLAQRRGFLLSNKLILGNGLLSSEGDLWKRQRRLMQPAFSRHRLAGLVSTMSEAIEAMLPSWKPFADSGRRLDLPAEMMHLALTILLKSMFSLDIHGADADAVDEALSTYLRIMKHRGECLKAEASSLDPEGPSELQEDALRKAVEQLEAIVYRIIDKRRRSEEERDDLLAMLLSARDEETGEGRRPPTTRRDLDHVHGGTGDNLHGNFLDLVRVIAVSRGRAASARRAAHRSRRPRAGGGRSAPTRLSAPSAGRIDAGVPPGVVHDAHGGGG